MKMHLKESIILSLCFLFVLPASSPAMAQGKRTFTPEDVLSLKSLSEPQISPAGDWVAFVVTQFGKNRTSDSEIWVVSADGLSLKQLTKNPGPDFAPRWSPDGSVLAFLSKRRKDMHPQVYVYSFKNKKTIRVTSERSSIRNFKWSPDGTMIAFLMADPPSPEELERRSRGDDATVVDGDFRHTRLWVFEGEKGESRLLTREKMTVWEFNWSADSKQIAFLASPIPTAEGNEYQSSLILIDVQSGEETVLCKKINAQASPSFSPDSRWVTFMGPVGSFKERGIIKVIPAQGGELRELLGEYEGNVWDVTWHPRENKLLASIARGTSHTLSSVSLKGEVENLFTMDHSMIPYWGTYWTVSSDGKQAAFLSETTESPPEIWVSSLEGTGKKQLTRFNEYLQEVSLGRVEAVQWTNRRDGAVVDGIVVKPPDYSPQKPYPLVVWLHGGPAYNWSLGVQISNWAQLFASQGYLVFLPNFRGSSGHGMKWMMSNVEDWGEGPMADVMSGVDSLIEKGWVDSQRLFVGGGSYGGYLTSWIVSQTDRFRAAYVSAGVVDIATEYALTDEPSFLIGYFNASPYDNPEVYRKNSPLTHAAKVKTPLLIVHGERDLRVPVSQAYQFYSALKHYGADVTLVIYPREYHGIREYTHQLELMNRVIQWFKKH